MSKYTAFRCPEDLLIRAKVKAKTNRRSLSNYLITLIEEDVKNDPAPPEAAPAKIAPVKSAAKAAAKPKKKTR